MDDNDNIYTVNSGNEQYIMSVSKDEYMNIYKLSTRQRNKSILICALIFVVSALIFMPFNSLTSLVLLCTGLFYILLMLIGSHSIKKNWVKKSLIIENRQYIIDIFDEKLSLSIIENYELVSKVSINYDSIISMKENNEFFVFSDDMQVYFIRKSIIRHDSILFDKFRKATEKYSKIKKHNAVTITFLILTFGLYAFVVACKDNIALHLGNPCYWMYFTVLPFSLGMIINSLVRKKRDLKWIPVLIAGIIISVLCIISGIEQVGYNKYYNSGYNVITETEDHLGIEMPKPDNISFYKDTFSEDSRIEIINDVLIVYYDYDVIKNSMNDKIWLDEIPDDFYSAIPFPEYYSDSDNVILYNVDTQEINIIPKKGTHQLVLISYIYENIDIIEYTITL